LDRTAQVTRTQQASALRNEQLLQHLPGHPAAAHRGGRYIHKQAYDLFLARAATDRKSGGTSKESLAQLRRALDEWCLSVEAGAETDASEMTDMFSLAHALSDTAAAEFVASIPPEIWFDESLVATEARVLLNLFHGKIDLAALDLDLLAGLCFEGDDPPDPQAEIRFRLLEALCQRNPSAFSKWRQTATEKLAVAAGTRLPLEIWLAGFDAVAMRLGVAGQAPSLKRS
jgi:hypothetical protein